MRDKRQHGDDAGEKQSEQRAAPEQFFRPSANNTFAGTARLQILRGKTTRNRAVLVPTANGAGKFPLRRRWQAISFCSGCASKSSRPNKLCGKTSSSPRAKRPRRAILSPPASSARKCLSLKLLTMPTAMNQVIKVATNAMPAPAITGRRCDCFSPIMLAMIAVSTSTHSKPFAKNEHGNVEDRHRRTRAWNCGVGRARRRNALPHQNTGDNDGGGKQNNPKQQAHRFGGDNFFVHGNWRNLFHASIFAKLTGYAKSGLRQVAKNSPRIAVQIN